MFVDTTRENPCVTGGFSLVRTWTQMSPCLWFPAVGKGFTRSLQMKTRNVQEPWNQNQWLCTGSRRPEKDLEVFVRVSDWLDSLWVRKHCEKLSYKNCWTVCLWEQPAAAAERSSRFFHQPLWFLWKEEESYLMVRSKNSRDGLWRVNTDGSDGSQDPMIRTTDTRSRDHLGAKHLYRTLLRLVTAL